MSPEVPEGWCSLPLRAVVGSLNAGVSVNSEGRRKRDGELGILKTSAVSADGFDPLEHKTVIPAEVSRVRVSPKADRILLSRMNTPALVGASVYVDCDYPDLFLPDRLWQIEVEKQRDTSARWLSYVLASSEFRKKLSEIATGTSGSMKNISKERLLELHVFRPPIHEQHRIAEILSSVDEVIGATQAVVEQTRTVKQGVLQRLLTRGIGHTRFKQTEIGEIPEEWDVVRISQVSLRTTYGFTNPMPTTESGPWMITAANVKDGKIDYETARKTDETAYRTLLTEKSRPEKGVVLITKDGTLGRVAIVEKEDVCINQSVASLTPDKGKTSSEFLAFSLQSPQMQERILSQSGGTSVKHIYITKLAETLMPLPPAEEQAHIVEILEAVQEQLDCQVEHLSQLQRTKSVLSSDLLTGRKRVSPDLLMAAE